MPFEIDLSTVYHRDADGTKISIEALRGEKGERGEQGIQGSPGKDADLTGTLVVDPEEAVQTDLAPNWQEHLELAGKIAELENQFEAPVQEQVNNWLDAHPEATTTVVDKSITTNKFALGALHYVTPEMFGAVGDGVHDDTDAVNSALNCGIGTVVFNKVYKCDGIVNIDAPVAMYGGGTIVVDTECIRHSNADTLHDVSIVNINIVRKNTESNGSLIRLWNVRNLLIRDCTFENKSTQSTGEPWAVVIQGENITVDNCKVINYTVQHYGDGLHFGSCKNVKVTNCYILSEDDCIAFSQPPENYYSANPESVKYESENIIVSGCTLESTHANILRCGAFKAVESTCGVHDCIMCDCTIKTTSGMLFAGDYGNNGTIIIRNIHNMAEVGESAIMVTHGHYDKLIIDNAELNTHNDKYIINVTACDCVEFRNCNITCDNPDSTQYIINGTASIVLDGCNVKTNRNGFFISTFTDVSIFDSVLDMEYRLANAVNAGGHVVVEGNDFRTKQQTMFGGNTKNAASFIGYNNTLSGGALNLISLDVINAIQYVKIQRFANIPTINNADASQNYIAIDVNGKTYNIALYNA